MEFQGSHQSIHINHCYIPHSEYARLCNAEMTPPAITDTTLAGNIRADCVRQQVVGAAIPQAHLLHHPADMGSWKCHKLIWD